MRLKISILFFILIPGILTAQYSDKQKRLGSMVLAVMDETYGIYHDSSMQAFVEKVGHNLEAHLDDQYKFQYFITDQEELNAFATAGGYVFVTRGLLGLINSEDELACVLGHEITHVTENHTTKTNRASILPKILELPANIIGLLTVQEVANIINFPIEASSQLVISSFSRGQERIADRKGVELALKAGYDPYMLPHVLEKMDQFGETLYGMQHHFSLFDDHPMTEDRVELIYKQLEEMKVEKKEIQSGTTLPFQDGLIFGRNPRYGNIQDNAFVHGGLRAYIQFPKSFSVQGTTKSVTAISPKGNSTIIVCIDSLLNSPELTAKLELKALQGVDLIEQGKTRVNGLEAYRATMEYRQDKHHDLHSEILWIKLPISNTIVRAVSIRPKEELDPRLDSCLMSIRQLRFEELNQWFYYELNFLEGELPKKHEKDQETFLNFIRLMNDMEEDSTSVEQGELKVVNVRPIGDFRYPNLYR